MILVGDQKLTPSLHVVHVNGNCSRGLQTSLLVRQPWLCVNHSTTYDDVREGGEFINFSKNKLGKNCTVLKMNKKYDIG